MDLSPEMLDSLRADTRADSAVIETRTADMATVELPAKSFDLIISSYAMHYLHNDDKRALLRKMHSWLAPGGRLVIADMMVGRSLDQHHRRVLNDKALSMLRRGPAGWWRLLKNVIRIGSGRGRLHSCAPDWWIRAVTDAGYRDVRYEHVFSEAGIVAARAAIPPSPDLPIEKTA